MSHQVTGASNRRARRQGLQAGSGASLTDSAPPSVSVRARASSTLITQCTPARNRNDEALAALQRLRQLMQGLRHISDNQWHRLEPLLTELYAAQKDIAHVMNHCPQAEGVGGFCQESLNFVKRLAAAMTGENPPLAGSPLNWPKKSALDWARSPRSSRPLPSGAKPRKRRQMR